MKAYFQKGFTLVEMMVVLAIIGLVLIGAMSSTSEVRKVTKQSTSETMLSSLKAQLLQFGLINKYLPCPDLNGNGLENRTLVGTFNACSASYGNVPYLTMGLSRESALDGWGNLVRYAVNTQTVTDSVCDADSSASYFCNDNPGNPRFTFQTPPIMSTTSVDGNYYVCNAAASTCTGTPLDKHLNSKWPSVVLVAFNEDASETFANCLSQSGATKENCDTDIYYHADQNTKGSGSTPFYDDRIETITGYEIKARLLSPVISWTSFTGGGNEVTPTFEGYDLNSGDYTPTDDAENPDVIVVKRNIKTDLDLGQGDDYVVVGNDLASDLQYNNVTGEMTDMGTQATLDTGEGNDTVYIVGEALSSVLLGEGDDRFVLGNNLANDLYTHEGNDKVWIQGNVVSTTSQGSVTSTDAGEPFTSRTGLRREPQTGVFVSEPVITTHGSETTSVITTTTITSESYSWWWTTRWNEIKQVTTQTTTAGAVTNPPTLDLGADDDVMWLGDSSRLGSGQLVGQISGGSGYDILVLENMTQSQWDAAPVFQAKIDNFELVIFKSDDGERDYEAL